MGETFISLDPDGQFWKKIDGCKADKQTKKSRALFLARGLKSVQCSTGVPEKCPGLYIMVVVQRDDTFNFMTNHFI